MLAGQLSGATIEAGDAYLIDAEGVYFGRTIPANSVIVALTDNPGLTTNDGDELEDFLQRIILLEGKIE